MKARYDIYIKRRAIHPGDITKILSYLFRTGPLNFENYSLWLTLCQEEVLSRRFNLDGYDVMSRQEVAKSLHKSLQTVRELETRALTKLLKSSCNLREEVEQVLEKKTQTQT